MSSHKASASQAIGAVLGTVASAATTVGATFSVIENSVTILNDRVLAAQQSQKSALKGASAYGKLNLARDLSIDQAKRDKEVLAFWQEAPENKSLYEEHYSKIMAAIEAA